MAPWREWWPTGYSFFFFFLSSHKEAKDFVGVEVGGGGGRSPEFFDESSKYCTTEEV